MVLVFKNASNINFKLNKKKLFSHFFALKSQKLDEYTLDYHITNKHIHTKLN